MGGEEFPPPKRWMAKSAWFTTNRSALAARARAALKKQPDWGVQDGPAQKRGSPATREWRNWRSRGFRSPASARSPVRVVSTHRRSRLRSACVASPEASAEAAS